MKTSTTPQQETALHTSAAQLRAALVSLESAENKIKDVADSTAARERNLAQAMATLDPLNNEAISAVAQQRVELDVVNAWLANATPQRSAVQGVISALYGAQTAIQSAAQPRCVTEATIAKTFWANVLLNVQTKELRNQIAVLRQAANEALRDITTLLNARHGITLSNEEIRDGVLRNGHVGIRRLTFDEINSGIAKE